MHFIYDSYCGMTQPLPISSFLLWFQMFSFCFFVKYHEIFDCVPEYCGTILFGSITLSNHIWKKKRNNFNYLKWLAEKKKTVQKETIAFNHDFVWNYWDLSFNDTNGQTVKSNKLSVSRLKAVIGLVLLFVENYFSIDTNSNRHQNTVIGTCTYKIENLVEWIIWAQMKRNETEKLLHYSSISFFVHLLWLFALYVFKNR